MVFLALLDIRGFGCIDFDARHFELFGGLQAER
jgi:hypothetical protein